ncbi:MAG: reverse transcriptase/maturase family protein, partial [Cytophagales bacterium]|nr:reverse transcriptase/maturase family protein [Cytophagales bacterium]
GEQLDRKQGTRQGGVLSPLLANIFMHHGFDTWMKRQFPPVKFERFADDVLVHCSSLHQAEQLLGSIKARFKECGLELHGEKTKLVYCKDGNRTGSYAHESFDFLGFPFRPGSSKNKWGKPFVNFMPAISNQAVKRIENSPCLLGERACRDTHKLRPTRRKTVLNTC